jgi:hypothetical protein
MENKFVFLGLQSFYGNPLIDNYPCAHLWKLNVGTFQKYGKNFHCVIWSKELFTSCANAAIIYYQVLSDKNNVGQNNYITCGKIGQHKYLHVLPT